jgi:hypothetical protein
MMKKKNNQNPIIIVAHSTFIYLFLSGNFYFLSIHLPPTIEEHSLKGKSGEEEGGLYNHFSTLEGSGTPGL